MIFIIQYFSDNLVCRRKIVSKHSDARQHWMIDFNQSKTKINDHTSCGKIYTYIYIIQESFTTYSPGYELLKRFSDIFQSHLVINQLTLVIYQQKVTCLELAYIFGLWLRTSKLLSVILCRLKLLALVDYHLLCIS